MNKKIAKLLRKKPVIDSLIHGTVKIEKTESKKKAIKRWWNNIPSTDRYMWRVVLEGVAT